MGHDMDDDDFEIEISGWVWSGPAAIALAVVFLVSVFLAGYFIGVSSHG